MKRLGELFAIDWMGSGSYDSELSRRELGARLRWFVALRWLCTLGCVLLGGAAFSGALALRIDYRILGLAAALLAATNLVYSLLSRRLRIDREHSAQLRLFVVAQTMTDYVALVLVTYATGDFEFPILVFFLCEITLVTLFCPPLVSFALTLIGIVFAVLPLVLQHVGVVPISSLLDASYKRIAAESPDFMTAYVVVITLSFLFFWYLVTEISVSLRQRERELEQAQEKLILLDREKSLATLRATHELKAPLAAINSYVFALLDGYGGELPGRATHVLQRIRARADLLMNKIVDIIHLSNLKSLSAGSPELSRLDLSTLIAREVEEARVLGRDRRVDVVNRSAAAPTYTICGAREQLHALFSNLLGNAVAYSFEDGTVEVELIGKPDRVSVLVRDQGIGIPEAQLGRIFDEHFRANNAVRHNPNGTGLGLSIVREIARLHRALVDVTSSPREGTCFKVTFRLLASADHRS